MKNKKPYKKILLLIFILALLLRVWGIGFGFPKLKYQDENITVKAAYGVATGKLDPQQYIYPASTLIYGVGALYIPTHFIYKLVTTSKLTTEKHFSKNRYWFHWVGRYVIALMGAFSSLILYSIGRKLFNRYVGIIAAIFLAVNPLHSWLSHYFTTDIAMTFFLLLCLLGAIKYLQEKDKKKSILLAGTALGLSVATKYPGIIGVIPILTAHIISILRNHSIPLISKIKNVFLSKNMAFILLLAIVTFSLLSPYLLINFGTVLENLKNEARDVHPGADGLSFWGNSKYYFVKPLGFHNTGILALLSWLGLVIMAIKRKRGNIIIIVSILGSLIFISLLKLHWPRWIIPVTPLMMLSAAYCIFMVGMWIKKIFSQRNFYTKSKKIFLPKILVVIVIILLATPAFIRTARINHSMTCYNTVDSCCKVTNEMLQKLSCENKPPIKRGGSPVKERDNKEKFKYFLFWLGYPYEPTLF